MTRTAVSCEAPLRYEHGVNAFDTANVYSNGLSEVYLGNAIKALNLPREEIVVMTKVVCLQYWRTDDADNDSKLFGAVGKKGEAPTWAMPADELDKMGSVNQHGLSRKVYILISSCMGYFVISRRSISLIR